MCASGCFVSLLTKEDRKRRARLVKRIRSITTGMINRRDDPPTVRRYRPTVAELAAARIR